MWAYNVVRALFGSADYTVRPAKIPVDDTALIATALHSDVQEDTVYCIKTHKVLVDPLPTEHDVRIICGLRDVRDAGLSYMRFMRTDFETCLQAMIGMMQATDYFVNSFNGNLLLIRYENISRKPLNTIDEISDFLGLSVPGETKIRIEKEFSKTRVKSILNKLSDVEVGKNGSVRDNRKQKYYAAVRNLDGSYRIFDRNTSFQSNHITSSRDGEWRDCFSKQQIERMLRISRKWLLKYGYET